VELVRTVQAIRPGGNRSQDRIFLTERAVIILDGATAFTPNKTSAANYVEILGVALATGLRTHPTADLRDILGESIAHAAASLKLSSGQSPSSTVAIVRVVGRGADVLVLGDSQIVTPSASYRDDRLDRIAPLWRSNYRSRLAAGGGYDDGHRAILRELQAEEARWRNIPGGYWIAEADPTAAQHAIVAHLHEVPWLVLSTDGTYRPLQHLGRDNWAEIARADDAALSAILDSLHRWEAEEDPNGRALPRAKRHDDKALAVVTP